MAGSYLQGMVNEDMFDILWNGKFYNLASVSELSNGLMRIDFSVVSSRREGHNLVLGFTSRGIPGANVFDDNKRFIRESRGDVYVTDQDQNFYNLLISLAAVLSYRDTSNAKDTKAANAGAVGPVSERVAIGVDQGYQDNAKKFEELQKQLRLATRAGEHTWDRARFEAKVAHWLVPVGAPAH